MEKTAEQKAHVILDFFKDAFDVEKAQFATTEEAETLKPELPIKLTATDGRGVFYVSQMVSSANQANGTTLKPNT